MLELRLSGSCFAAINTWLLVAKKLFFSYRLKRCMEHRAPFGFEKITA